MKRLFCLFALLFAVSAHAQAAGHTATLNFTLPTVHQDGTPITGALTVNVYQGVGKGNEGATPAFTGVTGTTFTITSGLADGTTVCWQLTAVEAGNTAGESPRTNEVCATFPFSAPAAPSGVTVTTT